MNAVLAERDTSRIPDPRIPVGIHLALPPETYYVRMLGEASNSALTVIDEQSARHYLHWIQHPEEDEDSEALAFGKLLHTLVLEPERFAEEYVIVPANAPKDLRRFRDAKKPSDDTLKAIAWWDDFIARNAGKRTADDKDIQLASDMAASLRAYEIEINGSLYSCGDIIDACEKEVTLSWVDEDTGLPCKARADLWLPPAAFAADLKSTHNASKAGFSHSVHRYRYHVQGTHYPEGFRACGEPLRTFAYLPVEKKRPHVPASWQIDAASQERGWEIRQRSMRKLARCIGADAYPGYTSAVEPIGIPAFGFYDSDKD